MPLRRANLCRLAKGLTDVRLAAAERDLVGGVRRLERGPWHPRSNAYALRPWQPDDDHAVYSFSAAGGCWTQSWSPCSSAGSHGGLAPYREVTGALVGRAMARSRRLTGQLVLAEFGSVRHRVLLALWHLADDWGRVRPDGVRVPVSLTHEMLGLLVGARRPAVTAALGELVLVRGAHR